MLRLFSPILRILLPTAALFLLVACDESSRDLEFGERDLMADFEAFAKRYNKHIEKSLHAERESFAQKLAEAKAELEQADDANHERISGRIADLERDLERIDYRLSHDGYFSFKSPADIPKDLIWCDGMDQPIIGDPRATKGGTFRMPISAYPATLRRFGRGSNHAYRGWIYDNLVVELVGQHPITQQYIPGIAKRWAMGADGRTVFYEIDPRAEYADGHPIRAMDFMLSVYVRSSDNVVDPYYKQYLKDQYANITVYDDLHLSISLPEKKPLLPLYASLPPSNPQFFADYGPDYEERYNWRFEPTPGPYVLEASDLKKGRSFTLTRKQDWWLKDHRYYRYLFNVDRLAFSLVRNQKKAFEMFRAGDFDYALVTSPDLWYEKSEIPPVFDGYIERYTFYNQYPRPNRGFYVNVSKPLLKERDIRIGIAYASNWQRVIDAVFEGDYSRLPQFSAGFGSFTNPAVTARSFSIAKAREYFAKAGFTRQGTDGILIDENGRRLSVTVTSYSMPIVNRMMSILKEEAKKCGLELVIDSKEPTSAFKYSSEKKHEIAFAGFGVTPPFPRYHQFLHSSNALNDDGSPKPSTNNLFCYADPITDRLSVRMRNASDLETIRKAAWKVQQIIKDEALFIPAYMTDYVRVASWRWVRWPDTKDTPFCLPVTYEPFDSQLFWIDEARKQETLEARKSGRTFPEVQRTIAQFRTWNPPLTKELPTPGSPPKPDNVSPQPTTDSE